MPLSVWPRSSTTTEKCFTVDAEQRVKQSEMYGEDGRDLVELAVSKMDIYLIVNTLQPSICIHVSCLTSARPALFSCRASRFVGLLL